MLTSVASGSVRARVRVSKSPKRILTLTVRAASPAVRSRAHARSVSRTSSRSHCAIVCRSVAERLLRADRLGVAFGNDVARVVVARQRVQVPAEARAERARRAPARRSRRRRRSCAGPCVRAWSASPGPTPHSRDTGSGARNAALGAGLDDEHAVGLGEIARELGEELRRRDADREAQPGLVEHAPADRRRDLARARRACGARRRRRRTPRRSTAARRAARSTRGSP